MLRFIFFIIGFSYQQTDLPKKDDVVQKASLFQIKNKSNDILGSLKGIVDDVKEGEKDLEAQFKKNVNPNNDVVQKATLFQIKSLNAQDVNIGRKDLEAQGEKDLEVQFKKKDKNVKPNNDVVQKATMFQIKSLNAQDVSKGRKDLEEQVKKSEAQIKKDIKETFKKMEAQLKRNQDVLIKEVFKKKGQDVLKPNNDVLQKITLFQVNKPKDKLKEKDRGTLDLASKLKDDAMKKSSADFIADILVFITQQKNYQPTILKYGTKEYQKIIKKQLADDG